MKYWKSILSKITGKVPIVNQMDTETLAWNERDGVLFGLKVSEAGVKTIVPIGGGGEPNFWTRDATFLFPANAGDRVSVVVTSGSAAAIEGSGPIGVAGGCEGSGYGVYGYSTNGLGVYGSSTNSYGVEGSTDDPSSAGVYGVGAQYGTGVFGTSYYGQGVYGESPFGSGISGGSTDSIGVYGFSNAGIGGYFVSELNLGLYAKGEMWAISAYSGPGKAIVACIEPANGNTIQTVMELVRLATGTISAGIGASLDFILQRTGNVNNELGGKIKNFLTDTGLTTATSKFIWSLVKLNAEVDVMDLTADGVLNVTTGFSVDGTAAVTDGTYTVGKGSSQDGTITVKGGIITAIQEAAD